MSDTFINLNMEDILSSMKRLDEMMESRFSDSPVFDGMMDQNNQNHIRTGIIQDPSYEQYQNRIDPNGEPLVQRYDHLTDEEMPYPLNGINAVDPLGMTVSVVWLDGQDGGLYNSVQTDSTPTDKVQRVILTFPQCWSDMDRSCGDFSLPLAGTVCRIAMGRNNVGVLLGTVPLDRGKLPQIRMGDFLKRHYTQNSHYMTDRSTEEAYKSVVNESIYKKDPVCETRGTPERPKLIETDEEKLQNINKYQPHVLLQASDGISMSAKKVANKHHSQDSTRNILWVNNLDLPNSISSINKSFKNADEHDPEDCSFSNIAVQYDKGAVEIINNDQNYIINVTSSDDSTTVIEQLKESLSFQQIKSIRLMNDDVEVSAIYSSAGSLSDIVDNLISPTLKCLEVSLSTGKIIICYSNSIAQTLLYISNVTAEVAEGHVSDIGALSKTIMGNNGSKIIETTRNITCTNLNITGILSVTGTLNVTGPVNLTGVVNVTGAMLLNGLPVAVTP